MSGPDLGEALKNRSQLGGQEFDIRKDRDGRMKWRDIRFKWMKRRRVKHPLYNTTNCQPLGFGVEAAI